MEVGDNLLSQTRADNYETSSFFSLVLQEMSTNTGQSVYVLSKQHNVMLIFSSNFVSSSTMVKEVAEQVHGLLKMNYIPVFVHTESAEKATEFLCSFRDPVISEFLHVADPHFLYFQQFGFFSNTRNSSGSNRGSSRFSVRAEITMRNSNDKRKSVRVPSFVEVLSLKGSSIPGVFLIEDGTIKAEYRNKLPYDGSKIDFLRMIIFPSSSPVESHNEQATENCKLMPDIRKSISLFQSPISIIDDSPSLPVKHKSPTKAKRLSMALARKSISLSSGMSSAGSFCESIPLSHQLSFRDSCEPPSTPLPPSTPQLLNKHSPEAKSSHSLTLEKIAKLSQYVTQNEAKVKKIKSNEAKTKTGFRPFSLRFTLCCGLSEYDDPHSRNSVNAGVNNVTQSINGSSKLGQRASSKMNVRDVLANNTYRPYFKLFATKEHSVENVLFWMHVEQFKKIKKPKERATRAKEIAELFFNESSMMQINTSEKLIELFYHDLGVNGPHRDVFDSILKDLEVGVLSDIFYRFKKSKLYKEMSEKSRINKKP